jgi:hypothetical protein
MLYDFQNSKTIFYIKFENKNRLFCFKNLKEIERKLCVAKEINKQNRIKKEQTREINSRR